MRHEHQSRGRRDQRRAERDPPAETMTDRTRARRGGRAGQLPSHLELTSRAHSRALSLGRPGFPPTDGGSFHELWNDVKWFLATRGSWARVEVCPNQV